MSAGTSLDRPLAKGSAKEGAAHWWLQRVTSIALLPLTVWFVVSLLALPGFDYTSVATWMGGGWHAVLLVLLVLTLCWHSHLGVQVIIEDYVHGHAIKLAGLLLATFAHVLVAAAGVFAVLKVAIGTH
jgi:succinate dehydrogenase / fumarate reductase membrane anchor subunit